MDEEQEILQSSLAQGDKISIDSFFGSPIGGLANRAIMQSNSSLQSSITNRGLIASLQASIELLKSQVRQITNYVLIDRQERNKLIRQRETEIFEREDDIQKGIVSPESAQPRGLEDSLPFFPEARFSEGLTAGMSSIGERQGVAKFQERFVEGSKPFFFGGLVPGSGDTDTVNAKLTPGEFVVPKEKVEEVGSNSLMNFVRGIGNSIRNFDGRPGSKDFDKVPDSSANFGEIVTYLQNLEKSGASKEEVFKLQKSIFSEKLKNSKNAHFKNIYNQKIDQADKYFQTGKFDPKKTGYTTTKGTIYDTNKEEKNNKLSDKQGKIIEFKGGVSSGDAIPSNLINEKGEVTGSYSTYPTDDEFSVTAKDDKEGGFFKNLFGGKKNESVKSDDKKGRDLFGIMGGTIDAATGNLTDFDKRGGKPFGLMRGITGTIDAATGGLTDLDRRGGKPFGLMRGITGSIDAMSGGLTDLDRRGGNPFGLMRGITGIADAMTRDKFDFDRRGKGGEMKEGFSTYPSGFSKENYDMGRLSRKDFKSDEDYEFYLNQFDDFDDKQLQNKVNQLPMETTVNPDGSITSKGSGTLIGGELVKPGQPLSENQKAAKALESLMGNKEMTEGFSTYPSKSETPSIEPVSQDNLKVAPSESIKETSQNLMTPPPPPPSETIELPPQIQGGGGGDNSISQAAPSFNPSTPSHDPLTGTESPLIFVEVISNPFLSIP